MDLLVIFPVENRDFINFASHVYIMVKARNHNCLSFECLLVMKQLYSVFNCPLLSPSDLEINFKRHNPLSLRNNKGGLQLGYK